MTSKISYLVVFVENLEKLAFFARIDDTFRAKAYSLLVISNRASVVLQAKRLGIESRLCRRQYKDAEVGNTLELLGSDLTEKQCKELYGGVVNSILELSTVFPISGGLVWNGGRVADKGVVDFCREKGIGCLFFEIGNIPGKMIADPKGVNARSLLAEKGFTKEWQADDAFAAWLEDYIGSKMQQKSVPQAARIGHINCFYLIDLLGYIFCRAPRNSNRSVITLLQSVARTKTTEIPQSESMPAEKYYFLPLQVTNDTQLYLNSDVDNEGALEFAVNRCKQDNVRLVVKPHPAEKSTEFLRWLELYAKENDIYLCRYNTVRLILSAELVITINSTVGLEALFCGKNIEVLGRAVYKHFAAEDLEKYVNGYLLDIDYFSDSLISSEVADKLISRLSTGTVECISP